MAGVRVRGCALVGSRLAGCNRLARKRRGCAAPGPAWLPAATGSSRAPEEPFVQLNSLSQIPLHHKSERPLALRAQAVARRGWPPTGIHGVGADTALKAQLARQEAAVDAKGVARQRACSAATEARSATHGAGTHLSAPALWKKNRPEVDESSWLKRSRLLRERIPASHAGQPPRCGVLRARRCCRAGAACWRLT